MASAPPPVGSQATPHAPQLVSDDFGSTQRPPQYSLPGSQPHCVPTPRESRMHGFTGSGHVSPHALQLSFVPSSTSQSSSTRPLQSAQAFGGRCPLPTEQVILHAPSMQANSALPR